MSVIIIRRAAERPPDPNPLRIALAGAASALRGAGAWVVAVLREREDALGVGRLTARELRDIGLMRVGSHVVRDGGFD